MADVQAFLLKWYELLLAAAVLLTLAVWYVSHFLSMAPKKGTLEWISMTDLPRMVMPEVIPIRARSWLALLAAAIFGAANCLLRMDAVYPGSLVYAAVPAAASVALCLLLLHLYGRPLSAVCACAVFSVCTIAGLPSVLLLVGIWLLALALMKQRAVLRVLSLLLAVAALAGSAYIGGALSFSGSTIVLQMPSPTLPAWDTLNFAALLCGTSVIITLIQAFRLHRGDLLLGTLLSLLCIALSLFSAPTLAYAGCMTALCGTFAASEARGTSPLPVTLILFVCTILSSI